MLGVALGALQLVCNAIQFLASVAGHDKYKGLFEEEGTLTTICENVIVPNMQFRGKLWFRFTADNSEHLDSVALLYLC